MIILLLTCIIIFGGGYRYAQFKERAFVESVPHWEDQIEVAIKEIQVHVTGAVDKPGVYTLNQGARVIEAVNLAGLQADADPDSLKLAAVLSDGQTVYVPYMLTDEQQGSLGQRGHGGVVMGNSLVNINSADVSQLTTLPGIGPAMAERIISYRETHGYFNNEEEIKKVSGIGDKRYQDLQDKITVN